VPRSGGPGAGRSPAAWRGRPPGPSRPIVVGCVLVIVRANAARRGRLPRTVSGCAVIAREGSTIRVERVESRMWRVVAPFGVVSFGAAVAFWFGGPRAPNPEFAIPMAVFAVVVTVGLFRARDVLMIEPGRLGIGKVKKPTVWSDRALIGSFRVKALPMVAVWFYSPDGKLIHTYPFSHFDPKELRHAFLCRFRPGRGGRRLRRSLVGQLGLQGRWRTTPALSWRRWNSLGTGGWAGCVAGRLDPTRPGRGRGSASHSRCTPPADGSAPEERASGERRRRRRACARIATGRRSAPGDGTSGAPPTAHGHSCAPGHPWPPSSDLSS